MLPLSLKADARCSAGFTAGTSRRVSLSAAGIALFALGCAPAVTRVPPPPPPPPSTFVARIGSDTVSIERYTRTPAEIVGRALTRTPRTLVHDFTYTYFADGTISRIEVLSRLPDTLDTPPVNRTVITFANDTAYVETGIGESARVQWIPAPRPYVAWAAFPAFSMLEAAAQHAPPTVGDSAIISLYLPPAFGGSQPFIVRRTALASVELWARTMGAIRVNVDDEGRALSFDGTGSALSHIVVRDPEAPFDSLIAAFAARDAGGGLGPVSPRDTARAIVHGANLLIDYGRPSARGREIFGAVVPWGRVWRTGANAATHLTVDRDVVIGALTVPSGRYTLWTLPTESGWELIVNRQTGQWGTEYNPAFDLGRTRMEVRRLAEPVEQFTIRIEPRQVGGVLVMTWDTYEASVPFSPR